MMSVYAIVAVIASAVAIVEEYSKGAEEEFNLLKKGNRDSSAEVINAVNGFLLRKAPEIVTGDTILFEATSYLYKEYPVEDRDCRKFEGIRLGDSVPFCKLTHFGFRVTGSLSEKVRRPNAKKFPGFSSGTSFGSSASVPLLSESNSNSEDNAKTYLEMIVLFKHKFQGALNGLVVHLPVFEIPFALADQSQETLSTWARNDAKVGISSPISAKQLKELYDSNVATITIPTLKWLKEVLDYDVRDAGIVGMGMEIHVSRPLLLAHDVIEGIMKLARKYLKVNKTQNEKLSFSKAFLAEISRRLSDAEVSSLH